MALKTKAPVLPVFIFDKTILETLADKKDKRVSFIHDALNKLNEAFVKNGSSLLVIYDEPSKAFEKICCEYNVSEVIANHDYEPYAIERDSNISELMKSKNSSFLTFKDQVLFEKSDVMKPDGTPYTIFTPYSKIWKQKLAEQTIPAFPSENLLDHLFKTKPFHFPALHEIGFEKSDCKFSDAETDDAIIKEYHLTRNFPSINGTSKLSIHLRFGTVSVRDCIRTGIKLNEQWLNELIWREFFMMILFHFPNVVNHCFKKKYENIPWINNETNFESWCQGETGYPLVDAGMRELNETGFMHNRVRMVVASFLTKHLLIDWRWGEAYFAEKLLDYELSSNNGNWQWAAGCGCDAAPYFRIFNPSEQLKRFDQHMVYVKKWINDYQPGYIKPMVEHDFARKRAISAYKKALNEIS